MVNFIGSSNKVRFNTLVELIFFLVTLLITILATYYLPNTIGVIWYLILLLLYYRSKNESFWLAFFFVLSDGFIGFFGLYETSLRALPGIPEIELAQFYILLSLVKAFRVTKTYPVFFNKHLKLLFIYLIFLFFWGSVNGMPSALNEIMRIFKITFPLLLFYSIPKLLRTERCYEKFFVFIFPVAILAFGTQLFALTFGASPAEYLGAKELGRYTFDYAKKGQLARVYYNSQINMVSFFAALYYWAKGSVFFRLWYLSVIVISAFSMAFLSATRGLVLSFSIILLLFFLLVLKDRVSKFLWMLPVLFVFVIFILKSPIVGSQAEGAWDRIYTVVEMAEGDQEALDTEIRTTQRGPRVISKWLENPVFGWGFSETFFEYNDAHVGNQSLLLQSGIAGTLLLYTFLFSISYRLWFARSYLNNNEIKNTLLVFPVILIGWVFLHFTTAQQFSFMAMPVKAIMQAIFFSFMAFCYYDARTQK